MDAPASPPRRTVLLSELGLLYAAAIWGSTFFIVKWAVGVVDPLALVAWRFSIAAVLMALWLVWLRRPLFRDFKPGLVLGLILGLLYVAQTVGLVYTRASNSGFITGLFIVFVPLCAWLMYRRAPRINHLLAVLVALVGLWLLTGGVQGINIGDWITLASAVTYALHVLLAGEYMKRGADPVALNFQQILVTALFGLVMLSAFQRPLTVGSAAAWWVIVFLAVFPTVSAFVIQLFAQQVVDPARTSLIFTMEPVFAAAFAFTLGGEGIVALRVAGGALIVAAMLVSEVEWGGRRAPWARPAGHGGQAEEQRE